VHFLPLATFIRQATVALQLLIRTQHSRRICSSRPPHTKFHMSIANRQSLSQPNQILRADFARSSCFGPSTHTHTHTHTHNRSNKCIWEAWPQYRTHSQNTTLALVLFPLHIFPKLQRRCGLEGRCHTNCMTIRQTVQSVNCGTDAST